MEFLLCYICYWEPYIKIKKQVLQIVIKNIIIPSGSPVGHQEYSQSVAGG